MPQSSAPIDGLAVVRAVSYVDRLPLHGGAHVRMFFIFSHSSMPLLELPRFFCRPEVYLVTLIASDGLSGILANASLNAKNHG